MSKRPDRIHPYVPEMQEQLRQGRISRREFLRVATLLGVSIPAANFLAACGAPPPAAAPTAAPAAAAAEAPATRPASRGSSTRTSSARSTST
jgi:peptide/nickel transport system substrate-binding protein